MEINDKYYEDLALKKSVHYDEVANAQEIVKRYIIREKRIVTGGMSIDFALKLKNHKGIYDNDALPDYDFFSYQHHTDAYEIGMWLYRKGFRGISIINALHPSTMKVRVNFNVVADITYVPKNVFDQIPTINYKGFVIIHPHVQMIDQHRALSFPYENAPWETVMSGRPQKDMKRYDILYSQYPIALESTKIELKDYTVPKELLNNQCVTGFFALNYWVDVAKKMGFQAGANLGTASIETADTIKYSLPVDSHGISLYSDNIKEVYDLIKTVYKPDKERFYIRFLDKLPRKVILDNRWELLENTQKITAHKKGDIYIANLQNVMMYLLVNFILLTKIKGEGRGHSFREGYLQCRELIIWASKKYYEATSDDKKETLIQFFPTSETYGSKNFGDSAIVRQHNFNLKNKEAPVSSELKYFQPWHVYDQDMQSGRIDRGKYSFYTNRSEIFNISGSECDNFLQK